MFPELSRKLLGCLSEIPQEQIWFWIGLVLSSHTWEEFCSWLAMTASSCPAKIRPLGDTIVGNDRNKTGADDD